MSPFQTTLLLLLQFRLAVAILAQGVWAQTGEFRAMESRDTSPALTKDHVGFFFERLTGGDANKLRAQMEKLESEMHSRVLSKNALAFLESSFKKVKHKLQLEQIWLLSTCLTTTTNYSTEIVAESNVGASGHMKYLARYTADWLENQDPRNGVLPPTKRAWRETAKNVQNLSTYLDENDGLKVMVDLFPRAKASDVEQESGDKRKRLTEGEGSSTKKPKATPTQKMHSAQDESEDEDIAFEPDRVTEVPFQCSVTAPWNLHRSINFCLPPCSIPKLTRRSTFCLPFASERFLTIRAEIPFGRVFLIPGTSP